MKSIRIVFLGLFGLILSIFSRESWAGVTGDLRPQIYMNFSTRRDPVDTTKVRMWLNREEVTALAEINNSMISYVPKKDLYEGEHTVKVLLVDRRGGTKTKKWSFRVLPGFQEKKFEVKWSSPTPANGAVVSDPRVPLAISLQGVRGAEVIVNVFVAEGRGGFRSVQVPWKFEDQLISATHLLKTPGPKTVLLKVRHKEGGAAKILQSSFSLDLDAPKITHIEMHPNPLIKGDDQDIGLNLSFSDAPFNAMAEIAVSIKGPDGEEVNLKAQDAIVQHHFKIPDKVKKWADGFYPLQVQLADYAGFKTKNSAPYYFEIRSSSERGSSPLLNIDPYPLATKDAVLTFSGQSEVHAFVGLILNGKLVEEIQCLIEGSFAFKDVKMKKGWNSIEFRVRDLYGRLLGKVTPVRGILVDATAPELVDLDIQDDQRIVDPQPEFTFKVVDPLIEKSDDASEIDEPASAGIDPSGVKAWVDDDLWKVKENEGTYTLSSSQLLEMGKHTLKLELSDRLKNTLKKELVFTVVPGRAAKMTVTQNRNKLYAWGNEYAMIHVTLSDAFGRPVADNTLVYFKANRGLISSALGTRGGSVSAKYIPGHRLGKAEVVVSLVKNPGTKSKATEGELGIVKKLSFEIVNTPLRLPAKALVSRDKQQIPADGGKSKIKFRVALLDIYEQPLSDGMLIDIATKTGSVSSSQLPTKGGEISFTYASGKKVGRDRLTLSHKGFEHGVDINLVQRKPGPAHEIFAEMEPKYVEVGSNIPLRIRVEVVDDFGDIVADGTEVTFKSEAGKIAGFGKTTGGVVFNNFQAPDKDGDVKVTISSGKAKKELKIPVVKLDGVEEVAKIWTNLPKSWAPSLSQKSLSIKGQLMGKTGALLRGTYPLLLLVDKGKAPFFIRVQNGIFELNYEPPKDPQKVEFLFYSQNLSLKQNLLVLPFVKKTDKPVEKKSTVNPENLSMKLEFHMLGLNADVVHGHVVLGISGHSEDVARLEGEEVNFKASRGDLYPKAYVVKAKASLPFSFKANGQAVEIGVEFKNHPRIEQSLEIPAMDPAQMLISVKGEVAKNDFAWNVEINPPRPGERVVGIKLLAMGSSPPSPIVKFNAKHGRFVSGGVRTWKGDEVSVSYVFPKGVDKDVIAMACGRKKELFTLDLRGYQEDLKLAERDHSDGPRVRDIKLLNIELVSGKIKLSAGRKDQTRLRFRIADQRYANIDDGTEVEVICPQAKISPTRVKTHRGYFAFTLQSTNWVGTYPLTIKVGRHKRNIDLTFTIPTESLTVLPELPRGPGFKLPEFPGVPKSKEKAVPLKRRLGR